MKIRDFPVIIVAAGSGERIGEIREQNKTLIEVDKKKHIKILDLLLFNLVSTGVRNIIIITGYRGENIKLYIEDLRVHIETNDFFQPIISDFKETVITCIDADPDYTRGPLYTLMTINKYRSPFYQEPKQPDSFDEMVNMIDTRQILNQIKDYRLFTVIPADTIFNLTMLQSLFNQDLDDKNAVIANRKIKISIKSIVSVNESDEFGIGAILYKIKSGEIVYKKKEQNIDTRDILLPIISVFPKFLNFIETLRMTEVSKIIDATNVFIKRDERNSTITKIIEFKGSNPPFFDIDTKEDMLDFQDRYHSLN
jgi:choline kinase